MPITVVYIVYKARKKRHKDCKEVKWSQFSDDIIVYMENPKESTNY